MEGKRIRELRIKKGDSLRDLGGRIGYSYSSLGKIERGELKPSLELMKQIASIYDVPLNYILDTDIPEELKEVGVEWVSFAKEMTEKKLTPDEIRAAVELIEKFRK